MPNIFLWNVQCIGYCYWVFAQHIEHSFWRDALPISEWSNDQPIRAANRLIHVAEVNVRNRDNTAIVVLIEVESRLFLPLKVCDRFDVLAHLLENDKKGSEKC